MTDRQLNELSEREIEILRLVATGASNKEIAQKLFISANTVKVHLRNIFAKVDATSRTEAAMYAVRVGLAAAESSQLGDRLKSAAERTILLPDNPGSQPIPDNDSLKTNIHISNVPERTDNIRQPQYKLWLIIGILILIVGISFWTSNNKIKVFQITDNSPSSVPQQFSRWSEKQGLMAVRHSMAAVTYENRIYIIGGENGDGVTGSVEYMDVANMKWLSVSEKPTPVADASAALVGGLIFVPGGRLSDGTYTDSLEVYDPGRDLWEKRSSIPVALSGYALIAYEGHLYLIGGWDGYEYRNEVYEYDPSRDSWSDRTPMPTERAFAGAAVAGGKIYVIGGINSQKVLTTNEVYQPNRDNGVDDPWTQVRDLPVGRYAMGIASVADIIHIVGGENSSSEALIPLEYFPQRNEWLPFDSPINGSWSYLVMQPLGTELFLIGGKIDGKPTSTNLTYKAIFTVLLPGP